MPEGLLCRRPQIFDVRLFVRPVCVRCAVCVRTIFGSPFYTRNKRKQSRETFQGRHRRIWCPCIFSPVRHRHASPRGAPGGGSCHSTSRQARALEDRRRGYHDFYLGYHPDTGTDRFYGGGTGGYYVYDVTDLDNPAIITQAVGVRGVQNGHTFTPTPDGNYAVAETEYQYAPLRIFDLQPGLTGETVAIRNPIAAWTANWKNLVHNHEMRWPYVFVSGYLDGLIVFNMMDPANPITVGHYDTYLGPYNTDFNPVFNGTFGVDVRNEDGLIVVSDSTTGLWTFKMEGFQGWNGEDWGMPNISSVQDWDNGPVGATERITTDEDQ